MMKQNTAQQMILVSPDYNEIEDYINENNIHSILLVCDESIRFLKINYYLERLSKKTLLARFSNFQPNPLYESIVEGVKIFLENDCDAIIAVGGGSAIDVAKCIKLYSNMNHMQNYLKQEIVPNDVKLLVVPTTAGTGSEATRYAVIYYEGEKQSITDESMIPSTVIFDPSVLSTLPLYQKKATLMDALCHSVESFWSVNSNDQSKGYSEEAIKLIMGNWKGYIAGEPDKNQIMLKAANLAGKAINITQTTAGHAMCYKLTSLYGIAHGHAAVLCVPVLWAYMTKHLEDCIDSRGKNYLQSIFEQIAEAMGSSNVDEAIHQLQEMITELGLNVPGMKSADDFGILIRSVNPVRLKNNPVALTAEGIDEIYHTILRGQGYES